MSLVNLLNAEQKTQLSQILEELGLVLDITKDQYDAAIRSYQFVAGWLADESSPLYLYKPVIWPQGSFLLGTMIKPFGKEELDLDLVCRLLGKAPSWTQFHLKEAVGNRLKDHGTLKNLLVLPDGRRCWTLNYHDKAKFHMDILPAVTSSDYGSLIEIAMSAGDSVDFASLAIRITDKKLSNYKTETSVANWLLCNPFGYKIWFDQRASLPQLKAMALSESIKPVPAYRKEKLPLQRVVQILKWHRDAMFNGDSDKPISIILTTLAAKAYNKETSIIEALMNVVERMASMIEERYSITHGRYIKWIANPVNAEENFADKWAEVPKKQENFYKWLNQLHIDLEDLGRQRGLSNIQASMQRPFGKNEVAKAFNNYGDLLRQQSQSGDLRVAAGVGIGYSGSKIPGHNFDGN